MRGAGNRRNPLSELSEQEQRFLDRCVVPELDDGGLQHRDQRCGHRLAAHPMAAAQHPFGLELSPPMQSGPGGEGGFKSALTLDATPCPAPAADAAPSSPSYEPSGWRAPPGAMGRLLGAL